MAQSKKNFNDYDEDVVFLKKMGQYIHVCLGHLIWTLRLASPLSYEHLRMKSSLNSSTVRRLEREKNFSVIKFAEAFYHYLDSIKCCFFLKNFCYYIENAVHDGKCVVVTKVDSSELHKYAPNQIIFRQQSDDTKELQRREKDKQSALNIIRKLEDNKWKKKSAKLPKPKKKKRK